MSENNGPIVKRNFGNIVRNARGYSIEEMKDAGIDPKLANVSRIPLDRLRKSKHDENVELLKKIAPKLKEARAGKAKALKPKDQKKAEHKKKKKQDSK